MEQTNILKFFKLGFLLAAFEGNEDDDNYKLYNRVVNFTDTVEELKLHLTFQIIKQERVKNHFKQIKKDSEKNPRGKVSPALRKEIASSIKGFLSVFETEIYLKKTFLVREKKFPLEQLIEDPAGLFQDPDVFYDAPEQVQFNLKESMMCLAFDRNTAAAHHIFLATEGYVNYFNNQFYEEELEKPIRFYDAIEETDEILNGLGQHSELKDFLHIIRKYYRNQSQHSNRKFSENEASDLMSTCINVMNKMHQLIKNYAPDVESTELT